MTYSKIYSAIVSTPSKWPHEIQYLGRGNISLYISIN